LITFSRLDGNVNFFVSVSYKVIYKMPLCSVGLQATTRCFLVRMIGLLSDIPVYLTVVW